MDPSALPDSGGSEPHPTLVDASIAPRRQQVSRLARGDVVGRYVVLDRVGAGAMGIVYAAFDPELERRVALKLLHAGRADDRDARARLLREAQSMARLSHPNVITVHDVGLLALPGDTGHTVPFLAMEYIDGGTLREWIGGRSWREIVGVYQQAAHGLAAAHDAGLVHRDFKPENVLISTDGRVRVTDFGLARPLSAASDAVSLESGSSRRSSSIVDSTAQRVRTAGTTGDGSAGDGSAGDALSDRLTRTGALLGTPAYMAPEQHLGMAADARADQFAFCVALFEALCGERPFSGASVAEVIGAVMAGSVGTPAREPSLPRRLRAAIRRGLASAPEHRFPDMRSLILEIERAMRPVVTAPAIAATLAVVSVAAVVVSLGGSAADPCANAGDRATEIWDDDRARTITDAFESTGRSYATKVAARVVSAVGDWTENWRRQRIDACQATRDGVQSETSLDLRMACLDRAHTSLRAHLEVFANADAEVVTRAADTVGALPDLAICADAEALAATIGQPSDPSVRGLVEDAMLEVARGDALLHGGKLAQAEVAAADALTLARASAHDPTLAEAWSLVGVVANQRASIVESEPALHEALYAAEASGHVPIMVRAQLALAEELTEHPVRLAEAEHATRMAAAAITRLGRDDRWSARLEGVRGGIREARGDLAGALEHHRNALAIRERLEGEESFDVASSLGEIALVLDSLGRPDEALEDFERASAIFEHVVGPDHPAVIKIIHNAGVIHMNRGDFAAAQIAFDRTLTVLEATLGDDHPDLAEPLTNLAIVASQTGRGEEALALHRRALALRERGGLDSAEIGMSLANLGATLMELDRVAEAVPYHERATAILARTLGDQHPSAALARHGLGNALLAVGRPSDALREQTVALAAWESALGSVHPYVGHALASIGRAHHALGHDDKAIDALERAVVVLETSTRDAREIADVRFALAEALWSRPDQRARARSLVVAARDAYLNTAAPLGSDLEHFDAWLDQHALAR